MDEATAALLATFLRHVREDMATAMTALNIAGNKVPDNDQPYPTFHRISLELREHMDRIDYLLKRLDGSA
jgi:hypothetical protein